MDIASAKEHFGALLAQQLQRCDTMRSNIGAPPDYSTQHPLVIGVCGGDGIGPVITGEAQRVLEFLLTDEMRSGQVVFKTIDGLTLENRIAHKKAIPDDVLSQIKSCSVILKGPTTTPDASYGGPNIGSANVAMRRELDLFANVRPVKIPDEKIDWVFFRENTEGAYALGGEGISLPGLAIDFTVTTEEGTRRIARTAYEYAKRNGRKRVSIVTKANVIKATDGSFLNLCREVGKEYPDIVTDDWYADIMTAKLIDKERRALFEVVILPNLYGDIITDEAAQIQGGVGTAGSANIGYHYAMFEAIHGSAPRMVQENRAIYADPCSMLRASVLLLRHIRREGCAQKLEQALDICMYQEKSVRITGRENGATCGEFGDYVMSVIQRS